MQIRTVHPFPARMAPELALRSLESLPPGSIVLDPMTGSGTVLRQAMALGHNAIGFDMDPLAVLMSRVWTTHVAAQVVRNELTDVLDEASEVDLRAEQPRWHDKETRAFIEFWFARPQRLALTRLAIVLDRRRRNGRLGDARRAAVDVLQVALSRIIITKEQCASLARDTSHSRPHRVADESAYDVNEGFERSALQLAKRIEEQSHRTAADQAPASVHLGDARQIRLLDHSVDAIMTSPPYLNAIDYMRGHRMSLVWLGHRIADLRSIRSNTIGAERGGDGDNAINEDIANAMCDLTKLATKHQRMVRRYADDLHQMMRQAARVLRPTGTATYVLGNSCLKDAFIRNSDGVARAAHHAGLALVQTTERDLPASSRYLPMTDTGSLSKRMRTETILTFQPAA
jgi:DNA modification methylase